jgi:superfamily II DNA/RNA helicase
MRREERSGIKRVRKPAVLLLSPTATLVDQIGEKMIAYAKYLPSKPDICALHGSREGVLEQVRVQQT